MKPQIFECKRCGHQWLSRDRRTPPRACAKCKSTYWDRLPSEKSKLHAIIRQAVERAIKHGVIVPAKLCENCGVDEKLIGHHDSYAEADWLKVRWLCYRCHARFHRDHPEVRLRAALAPP